MNTRYSHWPAAFFVLSAVLFLVVPVRAWSQIGAWIDAGHGLGCSPAGAPGFNGNAPPDEKDLVLSVAQEVHNRLGGLGYTSELTRTYDHCIDVDVRALIGAGLAPNDEGVEVEGVTFVSIHMDGDDDPAVRGTFVVYPAPKMTYRKTLTSYRVDSTLAYYVNGPLQSEAALAFFGCNTPKPLRQDMWVPGTLAPDFRIFWPLLGGDSGPIRRA